MVGRAVELVFANREHVLFGSGVDYRGILLVGLFHDAFEVAHHLHLLFEMVGVAERLQYNVVVLDPAEAHAFGAVLVAEPACEREACRLELVAGEDGLCHVEHLGHLGNLRVGTVQRALHCLEYLGRVDLWRRLIHSAGPCVGWGCPGSMSRVRFRAGARLWQAGA